jgi:hypothetical protein
MIAAILHHLPITYAHRQLVLITYKMKHSRRSVEAPLLPTHQSRGSQLSSPTTNLASDAAQSRTLFRLGGARAATEVREKTREASSLAIDPHDRAYKAHTDLYRDLETFCTILADTDLSASPDDLRSRFHQDATLRDKVASSVNQLSDDQKTAYQPLMYPRFWQLRYLAYASYLSRQEGEFVDRPETADAMVQFWDKGNDGESLCGRDSQFLAESNGGGTTTGTPLLRYLAAPMYVMGSRGSKNRS